MRSLISTGVATMLAMLFAILDAAPVSAQTPTWQCRGGVIALRFDDGPVPETKDILDALKANGLKATFFVIGSQVQQYPQLLQRIARAVDAPVHHLAPETARQHAAHPAR